MRTQRISDIIITTHIRELIMSEGFSNHRAGLQLAIADLPPSPQGNGRDTLWIAMPFPVVIRGVDTSGDRFEVSAVLDTLSTSGLYVRLGQSVELGATLFVLIRLSTMPDLTVPAPYVAARCLVARVERPDDRVYGIAVAFTRHRFLYARI
jgi:hypothetical protein